MNISRESASTWLSSTAHNQSSNSSISTDGSKSGVISEDDPSPQVWDLRWFAILSAPLLFGTIILPLATGPVIRSICHSYVRLRIYWVVVLRVVMVSLVVFGYGMDVLILTSLSDLLLIAVAFSMIWNARRHPWPRYVRIMWGSLLLALSIIHLPADNLLIHPAASNLPGFLGWVLNFAGMAYDYFRRSVRKRKEKRKAG